MRWPASTKRRRRSAWVATTVPLPGSERPSASVRQFIELAVNIPEHEPQVGQAERSITATSASDTLSSAAATIASIRSTVRVARRELDLACLHRPARDEDGGDVEAQRRHQHARRDLVAIRDADQRVGAMGVDHVFDAVGDHLARRQGIEHAVVAHRDAVVDGDGVELLGDAARRLDLARDQLAEILQMDVAGHELGEGIGDGDDRLAEIPVLHAGGAPEAARARHVAAVRRSAGTIWRHDGSLIRKRSAEQPALSHFQPGVSKGAEAGGFRGRAICTRESDFNPLGGVFCNFLQLCNSQSRPTADRRSRPAATIKAQSPIRNAIASFHELRRLGLSIRSRRGQEARG